MRRFPAVATLAAPASILIVLPFVISLLLLAAYSLGWPQEPAGLGHWFAFLADPFHWQVIGNSISLAAAVTAITLLLAYPAAMALVRLRHPALIALCYTLILAPLLISVIVRSYGWLLLLSDQGLIGSLLQGLGLSGLRLIHNQTGVIIAMVHIMLPFAILPLASLAAQMPDIYREAALDLGCSNWQVFTKVTLPLTLPGIIAAAEIVFALSISAFVTPAVLGGGRVLVLPQLIYDNIGNLEWSLAAVQAFVLLLITLVILAALRRLGKARRSLRTLRT